MQHKIESSRLTIGSPYPLGATKDECGINFAFVSREENQCGILLYNEKKEQEPLKIPFTKVHRVGQIWCGYVVCLVEEFESYQFYELNKPVVDPYAKKIVSDYKYGFYKNTFSWERDCKHFISYEESILYCLHVKGFTKHVSSKVKGRGTFQGIIEKIPYLKELGITALELMPAYEFNSLDTVIPVTGMYQLERFQKKIEEPLIKTNYWGYKEGNYFVPKQSYTYGNSPENEFKELVQSLHQHQIELIMQFYFPKTIRQGYILDVLKHWVMEYHIDGFHLKGENLPIDLICTEPMFSKIKIFNDAVDGGASFLESKNRNIALYRDDFMFEMRKFLKGDEGQVNTFLQYQRRNYEQIAVINYITNYYGFTLMDLVSYDKKNNASNGEENQDGTDYNFSWNCGVEGPTKRKTVLKIRRKQMLNAMCLVFLAQGTPLLMSGDEFGKTQKGNNNPYCQDNEISWINWNLKNKNLELYEFVLKLIQLRKKYPILKGAQRLKMVDSLACGYQDISYHGEEAWRPCMEYHSRYVGIMYCGKYTKQEELREECFIYMVYNMHWEKHIFALPKLPKGMKWEKELSTCDVLDESNEKAQKIELEGRTICIYTAK